MNKCSSELGVVKTSVLNSHNFHSKKMAFHKSPAGLWRKLTVQEVKYINKIIFVYSSTAALSVELMKPNFMDLGSALCPHLTMVSQLLPCTQNPLLSHVQNSCRYLIPRRASGFNQAGRWKISVITSALFPAQSR